MRLGRGKKEKKEKSSSKVPEISVKVKYETIHHPCTIDEVASIVNFISEIAESKHGVRLKQVALEAVCSVDGSNRTVHVKVPESWSERLVKQYIFVAERMLLDMTDERMIKVYGSNTSVIGENVLFLEMLKGYLTDLVDRINRRLDYLKMENADNSGTKGDTTCGQNSGG